MPFLVFLEVVKHERSLRVFFFLTGTCVDRILEGQYLLATIHGLWYDGGNRCYGMSLFDGVHPTYVNTRKVCTGEGLTR